MKKFDVILLILGVGIVLALSSVIVFKQFRYSYKDGAAAMQSGHVLADTEADRMGTENTDTNTDMKNADTNPSVEMDENTAENMNESKDAGVSETKPQSTKKNLEVNAVPDESAGEKKTASKSKKVCLAFAGDIYLSDFVLQAYQKAGNQISGVLDDGFREKIAEADLFVANEEFPFSDRGTAAKDKQFTFRLPTERVSMFQELGLDLVTLANNHALDFGEDALLDTCETLDKADIRYVGAGKNLEEASSPVILEVNGLKLAFLGATRVMPEYSWAAQKDSAGMFETYNPEALLRKIQEVRAVSDYVIVYVHWGVERETTPKDYQRTMGKQYIDAGADLVIGSHPHVLQGIEYYQGKPIVYSLGNFIFGSQIPKTMLLMVNLEEDSMSLKLIPGTSSGGYTRTLNTEAENTEFFQYMQELSFGITVDEVGNVSDAP
ncbi:MAG: CapA family protein [bacterium]|nr:CapA family protein [bacterium]